MKKIIEVVPYEPNLPHIYEKEAVLISKLWVVIVWQFTILAQHRYRV